MRIDIDIGATEADASRHYGKSTYTAKTFTDTTVRDCERRYAEVWDEIHEIHARVQRLRDEARHWMDLEAALETYKVKTAGELPKSVFTRHKTRLDKPIMVTI